MREYVQKHGLVSHFKRSDDSYRCGKCAFEWVTKSRIQKKEKLMKLFGSECTTYGYPRYAGALDFHHKIPEKKSFALSVKGLCYSWDTIIKGAKKCMLLCENCHAEVENGIRTV